MILQFMSRFGLSTSHTVDDFRRFSTGLHAAGSRACASYVAAIEKTNAALHRHGVFLAPDETIWDIRDASRLSKLYTLIIEEQAKGETGIYRDEPSSSYWKKSFCSAAIREYLRYIAFISSFENNRNTARSVLDFSKGLEKLETNLQGKEAKRVTKVRVNQYLFRKMVLDNYQYRCCVTGLSIPEVLRASHIKPWAEGQECRLDPRNGLCLSATFDAAFDRHLISLDEDLRLIFAPSLREYYTQDAFQRIFRPYEGTRIEQPIKFLPSAKYLRQHREKLV